MKALEPSLVVRIGVAKLVGAVVGLVGFLLIPALWPGEGLWLRIGILLWYTTFGALIGVLGMIDFHPLLKVAMPFWFRGIAFGAWLNLVLVFLLYERLSLLLGSLPPPWDYFRSPFWFVAEGALLGLVIDWLATRFGGEGKALL